MSISLLPNGRQQFLDANGYPLALGSVYFYIPGSSTFKDTWADAAGANLNANPVPLDAAGRASIWGSGYYRQLVVDSLGNTIWDEITSGSSSSADVLAPTIIGVSDSPYTAAPGARLDVDAAGGNVTIIVSPTIYGVFVRRTDTASANVVIFNDGTTNVDAITSVCAVAGILCPWRQIDGDGASSIITSGQG